MIVYSRLFYKSSLLPKIGHLPDVDRLPVLLPFYIRNACLTRSMLLKKYMVKNRYPSHSSIILINIMSAMILFWTRLDLGMFSLSDSESYIILIALTMAQKRTTEKSLDQELVGNVFDSWTWTTAIVLRMDEQLFQQLVLLFSSFFHVYFCHLPSQNTFNYFVNCR